jgi:adenine-specific DNA methylase
VKRIQEFTDDPHKLIPSVEGPIKSMERLPLPYTGNKKKLAFRMHSALVKNSVQFDSVLDAFTGSATVALMFKLMGKKVIANDLLTSSYLNAVAFVENPGIRLSEEEKHYLLHHQNPNKSTFVEDNYLGVDFRPPGKSCRFNKFTLKECRHLDNFRANIDDLCSIELQSLGFAANQAVVMRLPFGNVDASIDVLKHRKRQEAAYGKESDKHDRRIGIYYDEEYNLNFDKWFVKYVNDFMRCGEKVYDPSEGAKIKRASFLANLQQHILRDCFVGGRLNRGQVMAEMKPRLEHPKNQLKATYGTGGSTEMDFFTQDGKPGQGLKWWSMAGLGLPGQCLATNMDVTDLLQSGCQVECVYFDPPYGGQSSDYATMYRFCEEYIYSRPLEELPHIDRNAYKFTKKRNYETHFVEMLRAAQHVPVWLFSYNDRSWKDIDYIYDLVSQFKKNVTVEVLNANYRYLYRKRQGRSDRSSEYLIIAR